MTASEQANLPRWRGQQGFFEIWFLVIFDRGHERAWWLRYTLFTPAPGRADEPRATLWAAAFRRDAPVVAMKNVHPLTAFETTGDRRFGVRIGPAELTHGTCRGEVRSDAGTIAWELRFDPAAEPVHRGPRLLERLPLPTRVAHVHDDVRFRGWIALDGQRTAVENAPGLQKHIWGTRRVEELLWLYCPALTGPGARLELTHGRLRRHGPLPALDSLWLRSRRGELPLWGPRTAPWSRIAVAGPGRLTFQVTTATRGARGTAWCAPETLAGYVYRDPGGQDLYVAQSDVASCTVERLARPQPLASWRVLEELHSTGGAALEFHGPEPIAGVRYLPW